MVNSSNMSINSLAGLKTSEMPEGAQRINVSTRAWGSLFGSKIWVKLNTIGRFTYNLIVQDERLGLVAKLHVDFSAQVDPKLKELFAKKTYETTSPFDAVKESLEKAIEQYQLKKHPFLPSLINNLESIEDDMTVALNSIGLQKIALRCVLIPWDETIESKHWNIDETGGFSVITKDRRKPISLGWSAVVKAIDSGSDSIYWLTNKTPLKSSSGHNVEHSIKNYVLNALQGRYDEKEFVENTEEIQNQVNLFVNQLIKKKFGYLISIKLHTDRVEASLPSKTCIVTISYPLDGADYNIEISVKNTFHISDPNLARESMSTKLSSKIVNKIGADESIWKWAETKLDIWTKEILQSVLQNLGYDTLFRLVTDTNGSAEKKLSDALKVKLRNHVNRFGIEVDSVALPRIDKPLNELVTGVQISIPSEEYNLSYSHVHPKIEATLSVQIYKNWENISRLKPYLSEVKNTKHSHEKFTYLIDKIIEKIQNVFKQELAKTSPRDFRAAISDRLDDGIQGVLKKESKKALDERFGLIISDFALTLEQDDTINRLNELKGLNREIRTDFEVQSRIGGTKLITIQIRYGVFDIAFSEKIDEDILFWDMFSKKIEAFSSADEQLREFEKAATNDLNKLFRDFYAEEICQKNNDKRNEVVINCIKKVGLEYALSIGSRSLDINISGFNDAGITSDVLNELYKDLACIKKSVEQKNLELRELEYNAPTNNDSSHNNYKWDDSSEDLHSDMEKKKSLKKELKRLRKKQKKTIKKIDDANVQVTHVKKLDSPTAQDDGNKL